MWDNCCYPCYYFQGYIIIISVVIFLFHIRPFWCEVELDIDVTLTLDILWLRNSIYLGQIHFIFFVFFSDTFSRLYYKHCTFNLLSKNINWCLFNLWMFKNCSFSNFLIFSVTLLFFNKVFFLPCFQSQEFFKTRRFNYNLLK